MRKFMYAFLVALLLSVILAPAAMATDLRTGNRIAVEQGESVDDDMILTGTTVTIDGAVHGDVIAFAQTVEVNGTIDGNLITAGSNVEIKGTVKGTVLGAGSDVRVEGHVDGSLLTAGDNVVVYRGASVGRSWWTAGGFVRSDGSIGRGVLAAGSAVTMNGPVGREVRAWVDNFTIGGNAVVNGPVDYTSDHQLVLSPGARTGLVTFHQAKTSVTHTRWQVVTPIWHIALKLFAFLLFGLALLSLFPGLKHSFSQAVQHKPWEAPVAGFLALLAIPIGAIILMITIIGLPMGIAALLLFPVAIYVGQVMLSWTVGQLLADHVEALRSLNWVVLFVLGALVTTILTALPVVGGPLAFIGVVCGLGGLWCTFSRRRQAA